MPIDYASFNELSCQPNTHSAGQLRAHFLAFVQTLDRAWHMGLRYLRVNPNFKTTPTTDGQLLIDVITALPHAERNILLRAADSPHIPDEQIDQVEKFLNTNMQALDGMAINQAEGLLCALVQKTVAMSIASDPRWLGPVVKMQITEAGDPTVRNIDVPHASNSGHVNSHAAFIGQITLRLAPTSSDPLPNSNFATRFIANNDWAATLHPVLASPPSEKLAKISDLAKQVAFVNGFVEERKLSVMNQKTSGSLRQIFSFSEIDKKLYISTDFEKGAFELCDDAGRHLGEWLFWGIKQGDRDDSGSHDIVLRQSVAWGKKFRRWTKKLRK